MFSSVTPLVPVVGHTVAIYLFLILMFRFVGRRQLGQLNVIDLVIIIVMGSAVETAMVNGNYSLQAGLVCAFTLLALNRTLAFTLFRSTRFRHVLAGGPMLLVHDGLFMEANLHRAGLTHAAVLQELREHEQVDEKTVRFAMLEADGEITVVPMQVDVKTTEPIASRKLGRHKPAPDASNRTDGPLPQEPISKSGGSDKR